MNQIQEKEDSVLSVSDAVLFAKNEVASMPSMTVVGEVSGFRGPNYKSGHCYFDVKDPVSSMAVIVWSKIYAASGITLQDGMKIQMTGKFDIYASSGKLSFHARTIQIAGEGDLRQKVAQLAKKLEKEGLTDISRKRYIPEFCTRIGVVTSLSGSVIDDVKRTLARRNPLVELEVSGCAVQGTHAPATIIRALQVAATTYPDAILLVRGGGSFEDLMCFNDEGVARAIAACPVPVITGIGHEPDTTIADMVSDRRTSTPTAAAESVAPAISELQTTFNNRISRLGNATRKILQFYKTDLTTVEQRSNLAMRNALSSKKFQLEKLSDRPCLKDPAYIISTRTEDLNQTEQRLMDALPALLLRKKEMLSVESQRLTRASAAMLHPYEASLSSLAGKLDALSPLKVLTRGYAYVQDEKGSVIKTAKDASVGDSLLVKMTDGTIKATVSDIELS